MQPPKLNPEVRAAANELALKRDMRLIKIQAQMGACMSALGRALTLLLKEGKDEGEERNNLPLMELIGDAVRLLADFHHEESEFRQNLVSLNLDKSLRDMLNNTSLDGWLFGDNLSDRLKTAKAIEKSGEELKTRKKEVGKVTKKTGNTYPDEFQVWVGKKVQTVQKVQGRRGVKPYRQGSSRGLHPPRHYSVASRGKEKRRDR
ncbi:hypothetical protein NQ314_005121 [Rhamnusium bicolor]|uniref:Uncharacterized protein n=1 Tax=Rhamnusium bicolor TaxID=1586634 RepID=A0AAV8ZKL3_9CUCU|nr:hypothetical protein NQ314_005121 [Rhamnusium bicolor]